MELDLIDQMNLSWKRERPDLDPSALEVVGRILVLAQHLEKSVNVALATHGITLGQFDILATLRRQGPRGRMTPTQLMESVMLSSGGMTNRLDRLEDASWIKREADPDDRRGVVIVLTEKGQQLIDQATTTRFAEAETSMPFFEVSERNILTDLLRRWLIQLSEKLKKETRNGRGSTIPQNQ